MTINNYHKGKLDYCVCEFITEFLKRNSESSEKRLICITTSKLNLYSIKTKINAMDKLLSIRTPFKLHKRYVQLNHCTETIFIQNLTNRVRK